MSEIAWLNGDFVPADQAAVPVYDMGLVAGATVTEMVRTFRHKPYRLDEHLERLFRSIDIMGFSCEYDRLHLVNAANQVVTQNANLISPDSDMGIVVFVTGGLNLTYLGAASRDRAKFGTCCVHTFELPFAFWARKYSDGQRLAFGTVGGMPPTTLNPRAKHRNRLHWLLADREVRQTDPGAAALMRMPDGQITETSSGNFFLLSGKTITTPPSELVLGGISQLALKELALEIGYDWRVAPIFEQDVLAADEAWTTSTPYCLLPVTSLNGQSIGNGTPGAAFIELITAWSRTVEVDIVAQASQQQ